MMSVRVKSLIIFLSVIFIYFFLSCETQSVEITPKNLQHAEKHLEENMNNFIWKANDSYIESPNVSYCSLQIINSVQNVILVSLKYKNGKLLSFKYNYTVVPFKDEEYVELSLLPLSDYPKNYLISSLSIKLKNYKNGNIAIKINNSSVITFNKEIDNIEDPIPPTQDNNSELKPDNNQNNDSSSNENNNSDVEDIPDKETPEIEDNSNTENTPEDITPSYPSINDNKILEFQNSLYNFDYGLNDFYKQTYRYEYYPLSTSGTKYFVYEYKTDNKYYDSVTNEELLYPRVLIYFNDSYMINENNGHIVMKGTINNAFLRSGNKETGFSYYSFNSLRNFIQKIEVEILYNSPSSYHVIVSDDKNKNNEKEAWVKLNKRR